MIKFSMSEHVPMGHKISAILGYIIIKTEREDGKSEGGNMPLVLLFSLHPHTLAGCLAGH
jgi:hypothetical protein